MTPTGGSPENVDLLFPEMVEVLDIHRAVIEDTGGMPGLRDVGLLESALMAAQFRHRYEGADLAVCAATYAYHLTRNHPFHDGNKRAGAAVAEVFVKLNEHRLTATNDEIVALFLAIAEGTVSREEVESLFAGWVVPKAS